MNLRDRHKQEKTVKQKMMCRAYDIIDKIRELGFNEGGHGFLDSQIWQAAVDCGSASPDAVADHLALHATEGRVPPMSLYIIERHRGKERRL